MKTDLNDKLVRSIQIEDGAAELLCWDQGQDGLCLRVRANGARQYFVRYLFAGREKKLSIGSISEATLADARNRAYEIRRMAKDGVDPRDKFRPQVLHTVATAVTEYLAHLERLVAKSARSTSTLRQARLYLMGSYFAKLHSMDVTKVTKSDVTQCLVAIEKEHSDLTAHAARSILHRFYTWMNKAHIETHYHPVRDTVRPVETTRMRDRVLSDTELAAIWAACGDDRYGRMVRLLMLTGCRRQEVGGLRKAEVDLANRTWAIPAERTKTKNAYTVYLAPAAVDLVTAIGDAGDFDNWAPYKAKLDARLGDKVAPWTHHDLRRTMRTGLSRLKVIREVAEKAINHLPPKIERTYNDYDYAVELREAFDKWAAHVAEQVARLTGENVVEFPVKQSAV